MDLSCPARSSCILPFLDASDASAKPATFFSTPAPRHLQAKGRLYLVMEFCGGGDLAGYIRQHKKTSEAVARAFIQQLGVGMKEMWRNNFVHVRTCLL